MSDAGFNINAMFNKISSTIIDQGNSINETMNGLNENLSDSDMLKLQFSINQYNTMLEMASTVSKALVDEAKQIAQRAN